MMKIADMYDSSLYLFLPMAAALISAWLVGTKSTPALSARRWVILSMLSGALSSFLLMHYYMPSLSGSVVLELMCNGLLLCLAPCFYLSIRTLTSPVSGSRSDLWVFIPGTLLWLVQVGLCLLMGADESTDAVEEVVLRIRVATEAHGVAYRLYAFFGHQFFRSFVIMTLVAVLSWGCRELYIYGRLLDSCLSDRAGTGRNLWLLYFGFLLMIVFGLMFASCEYSQTFVPWVLPAFSVAMAVSLLLMGYFGRQVSYSAEQLMLIRDTPSPELSSEQSPLADQLRRIESEHLYRNPNLTIFVLMRLLGTNRTYLTRAIRQQYGCTFCEYVNRLRIAEARDIMRGTPSLMLSDIARRVGYNSLTTFYRNYFRICGTPPIHDRELFSAQQKALSAHLS